MFHIQTPKKCSTPMPAKETENHNSNKFPSDTLASPAIHYNITWWCLVIFFIVISHRSGHYKILLITRAMLSFTSLLDGDLVMLSDVVIFELRSVILNFKMQRFLWLYINRLPHESQTSSFFNRKQNVNTCANCIFLAQNNKEHVNCHQVLYRIM